jgi:Cof subfamily protein (haloacid dehalogenase superfamily)
MGIRLIAIDIDGTLLDSQWRVPEANLRAIADAAARGIKLALVTGRRFDFASPIAQQLACPLTLIVNNGALIKSKDGATHVRHLLPREIAARVLGATPRHRVGAAVVFDRPRENQVIFEAIDWENPRQKGYFERNREYISMVAPLEACLTEDPIQVMYSGGVAAMREAAAILRALPESPQFALALTAYESRDFGLIDVIHPGCSKGAALAEWSRLSGFSRAEVMAIGDNLNDREMLEFAGVPVVMGNSVPELKQLGWRETLSNDEGGVAAAITAYALGTS